ncbi:MAG: hypothetical protein JWO03_1461 [Bacteroidetes bacterium]|nr:hypothetical protein [Bacteroidota bacterium]
MEGDIKDSLLTVCRLLKKHNVKYMLVGGTAVALFGYYRHSINISGEITDKPDIDIWYNPTYENYFSILKVMNDLGQNTTEFVNEESPNPHKAFFKLDFDSYTLDILPIIKADLKFSEADQRKETVELEGVPIHFMGFEDLICDKNATAREKDLKDIEQLKKLRGEE